MTPLGIRSLFARDRNRDVEPIGLRYGVYADITVAEAFGFHCSYW